MAKQRANADLAHHIGCTQHRVLEQAAAYPLACAMSIKGAALDYS